MDSLDEIEAWAIYHIAKGIAEYLSGLPFEDVLPDAEDFDLAIGVVNKLDQDLAITRP